VAFAVVFPLLALFICFLRIWARRAKSQPLASDDHLVFLATVGTFLFFGGIKLTLKSVLTHNYWLCAVDMA
jgi:hypothetical protein